MANIAMFLPFGFLLSDLLLRRRVRIPVVMVTAVLFSLLIETLQLFMMRGLFEWDDVISNTLGAALGLGLYTSLKMMRNSKVQAVLITTVGVATAIICLSVYISGRESVGVEADTTSRAYCFQVDEAKYEQGMINLSGFTFRYERPNDEKFSIVLRSKNDSVELETLYSLPRPDVNDYFLCDYDYTNTGFSATGKVNPDAEYEVMIKWPWSLPLSTGVFIHGDTVSYYPEEEFTAPSGGPDLDEVVRNGVLRVYRPDYHCWVYQWDGALYWIADEGFTFEDDGTTIIQYQMWTTQIEKLPEKRLKNGKLWDNKSGHFEKYEMEGDFGGYRVMRRELPTAYSLMSIVTGYYKGGEWIWKTYFRPVYEFGEAE